MYIQVKKLIKKYGIPTNTSMVLDGVECEIEKGDIAVFLGPSGSGKSTLLNILGGIDRPDSGSVLIGEFELNRQSPQQVNEFRREKLGFIFQFYNLVPNLTVQENIEVGAFLSKNPLNVDEILRILGLETHRNKYPNQLSGGQQQRTGIGRAIVKRPDLLLCDEPTGALDYQTSKDVLQLIQEINEKFGCTVLMATHNNAIAQMAHKVFKLRDGKIVHEENNAKTLRAEKLIW